MKILDANPTPQKLALHCRRYWEGLKKLRQTGAMHPTTVSVYHGYDIFPAASGRLVGLHPREPVTIAEFSARIREVESAAPEQGLLPLDEIREENIRHEHFSFMAYSAFPDHNEAARQRQLDAILATIAHPSTLYFNGFWRDVCKAIFNPQLERFEVVSDSDANAWLLFYLAGFAERALPGDTIILGDDELCALSDLVALPYIDKLGIIPHRALPEIKISDAQRVLAWGEWGRKWEQQVYLPGTLSVFEVTGKSGTAVTYV